MAGFHRGLYVGLCRPAAPVAGPCFRLLFMQSSAKDWGHSFLTPLVRYYCAWSCFLVGSRVDSSRLTSLSSVPHYPVKRVPR